MTHVVSIVVLWLPIYIAEGWLKAATAAFSVSTAAVLIALVPEALKLPSVKTLQLEIDAHRQTSAALDAAHAALALKVTRTEGELRQSEQHRHQSKALLGSVIEAVPGLIYAKDRAGRLLLANKATLDLIGKDWAEVQGKTDAEFLVDRRQAETVMENDRRVMDLGRVQELEEIVTHPGRGKRVWLSTKVPLSDGENAISGLVGVSIDITERKQLAKELLHVSRRSAMGEMATAIAHEINQPLAAITLYVDGSMALLAAEGDDAVLQSLSHAKEQCLRAGEIIRRLRSFVSGGEDVRRPENVALLVDEACGLALLGSRAGGVTASITHDRPEIPALVDRVQIEQVIVNLVRNAIDAMVGAEGSTLHVTTGVNAEGLAITTVSDNGPGVSAEVAGRLFEPFVSTKGVQGMGVGLSICRTIIESHGGKIWVDPDAGTGATFHFTLPLCEPLATLA